MHRHLGVVLDEKLVMSPAINSKITSGGVLTGDFIEREVDDIAGLLNGGPLPARLKAEPKTIRDVQPGGG